METLDIMQHTDLIAGEIQLCTDGRRLSIFDVQVVNETDPLLRGLMYKMHLEAGKNIGKEKQPEPKPEPRINIVPTKTFHCDGCDGQFDGVYGPVPEANNAYLCEKCFAPVLQARHATDQTAESSEDSEEDTANLLASPAQSEPADVVESSLLNDPTQSFAPILAPKEPAGRQSEHQNVLSDLSNVANGQPNTGMAPNTLTNTGDFGSISSAEPVCEQNLVQSVSEINAPIISDIDEPAQPVEYQQVNGAEELEKVEIAVSKVSEPARRRYDPWRAYKKPAVPSIKPPVANTRPTERPAPLPPRARHTRSKPIARRHIPGFVRDAKAKEQGGVCIYCERSFGSPVLHGEEVIVLKPEGEHFKAMAGRDGRNTDSNAYVACTVCNRLKSDFVFQTFKETARWLEDEWFIQGYADCPPLIPFKRETNERVMCRN